MSSKKYVIELEMSEGNIFKEITEQTKDKILATDDGQEAYYFIVDEGKDTSISNTNQVDLYFGYQEDWYDKNEQFCVKNEWEDYFK